MTEQAVQHGASRRGPSPWRHFAVWASRHSLVNRLAVLLIIAGIAAGLATYAALTESPPFGHDPDTVYLLLNLDLVILLVLGAIVARRIVGIWVRRRRGLAGSRLHVRLVAMFSVVAVAPAIVVAAFSAMFLHLGVESWFSERVRTAVNESLSVADSYLVEHQNVLRADILAMANDLNREAPRLVSDPAFFNSFVDTQATLRNLTEALVFDGTGRTLARSSLTFMLQFEEISPAMVEEARTGEVLRLDSDIDDRIRAVVRLDRFVDTYLLVGRLVEPSVIAHMERARGAVDEYQALEDRQSQLQITFTLIYVVVALLLLLIAVWIGLSFAGTLMTPTSNLIAAAERVRAGDLAARVPTDDRKDELSSLSFAFNRMTMQLESQRRDLVEANRQLDERRRFTETVLAGVSAGVLGLGADGRIDLPNKSATQLLGRSVEELVNRPLAEAVPEMTELMERIRERPRRLVESQVRIRHGDEERMLLVRIAAQRLGGEIRGYVVTFDDVTELLSAQRKAAWADVARRIAHEIKNPLTPIQLSAERLKRRYLKQIDDDPDTFVACTDTIVRQVGDIGRMVDEFSAFARMPRPVLRPTDLSDVANQALVLYGARSDIRFSLDAADSAHEAVDCDPRLVSQAMTNLLQNAVDAIDGRPQPPDGTALDPGLVVIRVGANGTEMILTVEDNGRGLPADNRDALTEPYVTTRAKGTGLGLAIVKKIMEEHGGRIVLSDRPGGGASAMLAFPMRQPD